MQYWVRYGWVVRAGTGDGYGTRWVRGRGIPVAQHGAKRRHIPAKRAPEPPCRGGGVGGDMLQRPRGHPGCFPTTPAGPAPCGRCRAPGLSNAASGPITARFDLNSSKVSKNGIVSPGSVHKACHTPYFQNGLVMSPLEILGFPYSPAFSHKELMTHI